MSNLLQSYRTADFVMIAAPTNYDDSKNYYETSVVETVIQLVAETKPNAVIFIKSTVPVGYTQPVLQSGTDERNI